MANKALVLFFLAYVLTIMISPLVASMDKESVPVDAQRYKGHHHHAPAHAPDSSEHHRHSQAPAKAPGSLEHHHNHVPPTPVPAYSRIKAPPSSIVRNNRV